MKGTPDVQQKWILRVLRVSYEGLVVKEHRGASVRRLDASRVRLERRSVPEPRSLLSRYNSAGITQDDEVRRAANLLSRSHATSSSSQGPIGQKGGRRPCIPCRAACPRSWIFTFFPCLERRAAAGAFDGVKAV